MNLLMQTIVCNIDNDKLSDKDFRDFVRNSTPSAEGLELLREKEIKRGLVVDEIMRTIGLITKRSVAEAGKLQGLMAHLD